MNGILSQTESAPEVVRRLEWAGLPQGWGAVAFIGFVAAVLYAVVWMYRSEGRAGASMRIRLFLAGIRGLVLLVLAGIWLEPVLATYLRRAVESHVLVLVDASSSMRLKDSYRDAESARPVRQFLGDRQKQPDELTRATLAQDVLGGRFLEGLAARNRVKVFTFSSDAKEAFTLPSTRGENRSVTAPALEVSPVGQVTDLGRAVRRAVESVGGGPLSAVVVLSDGGLNQGEPADIIGQYVRSIRAPIHTIGIGDPAGPRNVRIVDVLAPSHAFMQDPFTITAQLGTQGLENESVLVQLVGGERVLAERTVQIGAGGHVEPVSFEHAAEGAGPRVYRVHVPALEYETITEDNTRQVSVNVIENRIRALVVGGSPGWTYRYVVRLLERDETIDVSCWLQSADVEAVRDGNTIIDHLPATDQELFEYDVIILLDPDPREFSEPWCKSVGRLVSDYGGGLFFQASRKYTSAFVRTPELRPLLDLLPVAFDPDADLILNELGHYQTQPSSVSIPPESQGHPILSGAARSLDRQGWSRLGEVYWHYPVLREKPAATVLMRHANPRMQNAYGSHVLFAGQSVGTGRTLFLGFDGTWRWRRFGDEHFNRFWIRSLRYLTEGKLLGSRKRAVLLTDRDTHTVGGTVVMTARLLDENYKPMVRSELLGVVRRPSGEERELAFSAIPGRQGWYQAEWVPPQTGLYRVEIALSVPNGEPVLAVKDVQVAASDLELEQPKMHRDTLRIMAEGSDGGRYFDIHEAARIPGIIEDRHQSFETPGRPRVLWDSGWTLVALVLLLGIEWAVRKRVRLL